MSKDELAEQAVRDYMLGTNVPVKQFIKPYNITYTLFQRKFNAALMNKNKPKKLINRIEDGFSIVLDKSECELLYNFIKLYDTDKLFPISKERLSCQVFRQMAIENLARVAKKLYMKNFSQHSIVKVKLTLGEASSLCYISSLKVAEDGNPFFGRFLFELHKYIL